MKFMCWFLLNKVLWKKSGKQPAGRSLGPATCRVSWGFGWSSTRVARNWSSFLAQEVLVKMPRLFKTTIVHCECGLKTTFFVANVVWLCVVNGFKVVDLLLHVMLLMEDRSYQICFCWFTDRSWSCSVFSVGHAEGKTMQLPTCRTPTAFMAFCQNGAVDMDTFWYSCLCSSYRNAGKVLPFWLASTPQKTCYTTFIHENVDTCHMSI